MSGINLADFSFLIVDDVRICRMNVIGVLKGLGVEEIHEAENGKEAIDILQDRNIPIDCVISDFDMPEMNGLELLRAVRTGIPNTRRELPIAMLTGHGDESLVGLALALDVNTFILKPAQKEKLASRLERLLTEDQNREKWVRPAEAYKSIQVDIAIIKASAEAEPDEPKEEVVPEADTAHEIMYQLSSLPASSVLSRDIVSETGRTLYEAGTEITDRHVTRLKGLKDLGFFDGNIWIRNTSAEPVAVPEPQRKPQIDPSASSSAEGGLQRSTFSRYGKLNIGCTIQCQRCSLEFSPSPEVIRKHNRSLLTFLLCPICTERDTKLLCACVQYMVAKGGFPLDAGQLVQAFIVPDEKLPSPDDDPFKIHRRLYQGDPLTVNDIMCWVHANFFALDPEENKLECMIDRILSDPERVQLVGKAGLDAKKMAINRTQRLKSNK